MSHEYGPDGSIVVHHDRCSWTAVHGKEAPSPEPWDRAWTFLCCCEVIEGVEAEVRALTLDAARAAIEAIPDGYKIRGEFESYSTYHEGRSDFKDGALTAIDELRQKT